MEQGLHGHGPYIFETGSIFSEFLAMPFGFCLRLFGPSGCHSPARRKDQSPGSLISQRYFPGNIGALLVCDYMKLIELQFVDKCLCMDIPVVHREIFWIIGVSVPWLVKGINGES